MATEVVSAEGAAAHVVTDESRLHAPSWLDRLVGAIDAAPGPTWLAYVVLTLVLLLLVNAEGWLGGIQVLTIDPQQSVFTLFFVVPVALYHYLRYVAGDTWDRFRPATDLDDRAAAELRYSLTTTPARAAWVLLALGAAVNLTWIALDPAGVALVGVPLAYVVARAVTESFLSGLVFVLVFQVLRQLRLINGLHRSAARIDLYRPAPLHAFSRLTARAAIGIIFFAVLTGLPVPGIPEQSWLATVFIWTVPMLLLGVAAFVVPLRGVNERLVKEKQRMLDAIGLRLRMTTETLHHIVDEETANNGDVDASRLAQTRVDALSKALASLFQERDYVRRLSTWPWDGSTFRAVASAFALPIVLFLITRVLDRFV